MSDDNKKITPIVKYDNKLNLIPFKGMTKLENDIFFALLYKLREQGTEELNLEFSELKRLIGFQGQRNAYVNKLIENVSKKISQSIIQYDTAEATEFFSIFRVLRVPKQGDTCIQAKISETFAFMINNLKQGFTAFELAEFNRLQSRYSQTLYRLLKQFKHTGFLKMEWEKFKEIMDIPVKMKMNDIDSEILKPVMRELQTVRCEYNTITFQDLTYLKTKTPGMGNKITGIEFYFLPISEKDDKYNKNTQLKDAVAANSGSINNNLQHKKLAKQLENIVLENTQQFIESYINKNFIIPKRNDNSGVDILKLVKVVPVKNRKKDEANSVRYKATFKNIEDGYQTLFIFHERKHFEFFVNSYLAK